MPDVLYTDTPFTAVSTMVVVTYLPLFVTLLFRGMPDIWKALGIYR